MGTEPSTDELERELNAWLRSERGIEEPRRIVRMDERHIRVSKVAPGFALELYRLVERMPELFDPASVLAACAERAARADPDTTRSENWRDALHALLRRAGEREGIAAHRLAEVRTAIDSVYAVLDTVLWSCPRLRDRRGPAAGEVSAYREGVASLEPGRNLFRRYYGQFAERAVENHCPGAALARTMLEQAWRACTDTPAPEHEGDSDG